MLIISAKNFHTVVLLFFVFVPWAYSANESDTSSKGKGGCNATSGGNFGAEVSSASEDDVKFEDNFPKVSPVMKQIMSPRKRPHNTVKDLIKNNGFPFETHFVTSSDGYVTTLFRIPYGRKGPNASSKPKKAVILHHGVFADAGCWILNAVNKALAYRLADLGNVDVWMTNNRGTFYSLEHDNVTHKGYSYWNYSFHEIGVYDVPKIIDYILETTKLPDLYYVGHSMGSSAFFVAMSTHPEYNAKIRTFIGLAPAVFAGNATFAFQFMVPGMLAYQFIHDAVVMGPNPVFRPEILPLMQILGDVCSPRFMSQWVCYTVVDAFFGFDIGENDYDMATEIVANGVSSVSSKTAYHLLQLWKNAEFAQYDYFLLNPKVYGRTRPPKYDLSKTSAPVVLFGGNEDNLISPPDLWRLAKSLPNVKEVKIVPWPMFNHIDFVFAKDINRLLNNRIVQIIDQDLYYASKA